MIIRSRLLRSLLFVALTGLVAGCGGGGGGTATGLSTQPLQAGKVSQGPVKGAIVFADRVDGGTRFVKDAGEVWTTTDDNGNYRLPSVPTYKYVLVTKGGTDTLTKLPSIQLLAQRGSANITVLTTLLTLDTSKTLYKKLQLLLPAGSKIDLDVSTHASKASLLLTKSVETAVQTIVTAVNAKAAASGYIISDQQIADVQFQTMQQIALSLATTTELLDTPAGLKAALATALVNVISEINKAPNLAISATAAASIADNAVTAAATALGTTSTSTTALDALTVQSEIALATADPVLYAAAFSNAISGGNPTFALVSSLVVTSASTPDPYGPADIIVLFVNDIPGTITGSTGNGGGGGGTGGGF